MDIKTSTITLIVNTDEPQVVEDYVRDCIDNADAEWDIETATVEVDGVITDLLDEETELTPIEDDTTETQAETETTQTEDTTEETDPETEPSRLPTGKEF